MDRDYFREWGSSGIVEVRCHSRHQNGWVNVIAVGNIFSLYQRLRVVFSTRAAQETRVVGWYSVRTDRLAD